MDLTQDFNTYWELMSPAPIFYGRKDAAKELWDNNPGKQGAIIKWLKKHGTYLTRNPS